MSHVAMSDVMFGGCLSGQTRLGEKSLETSI